MSVNGAKAATLRVFRFDPEVDAAHRYDTYQVPMRPGLTVLEALFYVLERLDGSLAFRYSCRGAVCGACAMRVNGRFRLACRTQLGDLGDGEVLVEPLHNLPLIKDLVVDMDPFFEKYERIMPYLIANTEMPPEEESYQSPKDRLAVDEMIGCILCGACYAACTMCGTREDYLGPAALTKAYRFVADSRDEGRKRRLEVVSGEDGVLRCHTIFNCAEVCPKEINPTASIQALKKLAARKKLGLG
ncbi:MAG: succinate dehydrogenase iron-sulfur subunit [Firmicutes bacterium]|nr:succinate dehydrogenase iron-sulfur subunit [Bacillota bacterium]